MNVCRLAPGRMFMSRSHDRIYFVVANTKSSLPESFTGEYHDIVVLFVDCARSTMKCVTWECMKSSVEFFGNEDWISI